MRRILSLFLAICLAGCARHPLLERQIESAYADAAALDTLHDFEVAELTSAAGLARVEGLLAEERNDPELLVLAARGWCRYAFLFAWDARESALERGDASAALYHAERALGGFERARSYSRELLQITAPGYPEDPKKLGEYLSAAYGEPEEAPLLLWAGCAELGVALVETDGPRAAAAREAATLLLDHALALDATLGDGTGELLRALSGALSGEGAKAVSARLDRARKLSRGELLFVDLARAVYVDCAARDEAAFVRTLDRVVRAPDPSARRRLDNVVAKRRARRYLESAAWRARCRAP